MSHLIPISTDQVYPVVTVMETIEALLDKTYGKPIVRNQIVSEEVIEGIRHVTVTVPDSPYWDGTKMRPAASRVVTALANGDLHGIIKIDREGQFYRLPRKYWVGLDYQADHEAFASVPTAIRTTAVDPAIVGSVIMLAEKEVTAWLAGVALSPEQIARRPQVSKPRPRRGGGRPKPDWYQDLHRIMSEHNARRNVATAHGRHPPAWPVAKAFLSKLLGAHPSSKPPTYSAVAKHVKKIKMELLG